MVQSAFGASDEVVAKARRDVVRVAQAIETALRQCDLKWHKQRDYEHITMINSDFPKMYIGIDLVAANVMPPETDNLPLSLPASSKGG